MTIYSTLIYEIHDLFFFSMYKISPFTGIHNIQGPHQVQNQFKTTFIVHGWSYYDAYSFLLSNIAAIIHLQYLVLLLTKQDMKSFFTNIS